jgi:uncharacterized membrane protein
MRPLHLQRYVLTGLLTVIPLWITWLVFKFLFNLLSQSGAPVIAAIFNGISYAFPSAAAWLGQTWLVSIIGFVATLLALYLIGLIANRVLGQRLLAAIDNIMERIPLVHSIYGGTKKLMSVLQNKPTGTQRVVLIDFPSPELKTIGFVTRVFTDAGGRELAAVYVPTTPNPTGGYLEIVPLDKLTATDWSVDQAMAFILSGGAVSPDTPLPGAPASPATRIE